MAMQRWVPGGRWLFAALAGLVLACLFVLGPIAHGLAGERISQRLGDESLRYPRYLKNPETKQLGPGSSVVFWRTTDDTCGLYTWGEFVVAPGQGAPPHLHYGDEEWFIPTKPGKIRMFAAKNGPHAYHNGELPGFNTPPEEVGSTEIDLGDVIYSPTANVHYFSNDNPVPIEGFLNIWAPGFGIRRMFDSFKMVNFKFSSEIMGGMIDAEAAQQLIEKTGLWGVPHDVTGKEVGHSDYTSIRGPLHVNPSNLKHLQRLIEAGERCYPKDGIRPVS
jgi:hypothetical protein